MPAITSTYVSSSSPGGSTGAKPAISDCIFLTRFLGSD